LLENEDTIELLLSKTTCKERSNLCKTNRYLSNLCNLCKSEFIRNKYIKPCIIFFRDCREAIDTINDYEILYYKSDQFDSDDIMFNSKVNRIRNLMLELLVKN
jgi:hypothetical protein